MSLVCPVGPETNLLSVEPACAKRLVIEHPLLTPGQMKMIKDGKPHGWHCTEVDISYPIALGPKGLIQVKTCNHSPKPSFYYCAYYAL